jgi:hypothetical protein
VPGVTLVDQFGTSTAELKKAKFLCAPTDPAGEDATAPSHPEHEKGYQVRPAVRPVLPTNQRVVDRFNPGGLFVDVKKPSHLLVPAVTSLVDTPPTPAAFVVDRFQCYRVSTTRGTPKFVPVLGFGVADQFGQRLLDVKKARYLCAPVDALGQAPGAEAHAEHLMCYQVRQPVGAPRFAKVVGAGVNDQFGPASVDAKKPTELCVPALVNP